MEIQRTAAASTFVTFPMLSTAGLPLTGLTVAGSWIAWADTAGPNAAGNPGFLTLSGAVSELAVTGTYTNALASTELPAASPYVMLRYNATGAATQYLLVRTATFFAHASVVGTGAIVAGSFAAGAIDASAIAANAIGASEIADGAIDSGAIATGAIDADALAADAVAEIADGVWDEDIYAAHGTDGTAGLAARRIYHATDFLNAKMTTIGSTYADDFLGRTITRGASGGRTVGQAMMALRDRVAISAGTLTVYSTDDTTAEWTASIATQSVTAIVTDINPA